MKKMGLEISIILDDSMALFRRYWHLLLTFPLLASLFSYLLHLAVPNKPQQFTFSATLVVLWLIGSLLMLVMQLSLFVQVKQLSQQQWQGYWPLFISGLKKMLPALWVILLAVTLLGVILLVAGFVSASLSQAGYTTFAAGVIFLAVILALYWFVRFLFAVPAIVLDNYSALASIRESFILTNSFYKIMKTLLAYSMGPLLITSFVTAPMLIVLFAFGLAEALQSQGNIFIEMLISVLQAVFAPIIVTIHWYLYENLKAEKDELERLAEISA